jgi:hypothetical protein
MALTPPTITITRNPTPEPDFSRTGSVSPLHCSRGLALPSRAVPSRLTVQTVYDPTDSRAHSMNTYSIILGLLILVAGGCKHGAIDTQDGAGTTWEANRNRAYADDPEEGVRSKGGNSVSARIWALINNGQFAEAQALIAEAKVSGLISAPLATRMLDRIALLNTRVGQLPATLQRARNFPSQLKEHTLFEVKQMLDRNDFSLATEAQLKMVSKIIKNPGRLMEKL